MKTRQQQNDDNNSNNDDNNNKNLNSNDTNSNENSYLNSNDTNNTIIVNEYYNKNNTNNDGMKNNNNNNDGTNNMDVRVNDKKQFVVFRSPSCCHSLFSVFLYLCLCVAFSDADADADAENRLKRARFKKFSARYIFLSKSCLFSRASDWPETCFQKTPAATSQLSPASAARHAGLGRAAAAAAHPSPLPLPTRPADPFSLARACPPVVLSLCRTACHAAELPVVVE